MKRRIIGSVFVFLMCSVFNNAFSNEQEQLGKIKISHEIKYTKKGTRSEAQSGFLYIEGILVPDCFAAVSVDGKVFNFFQRSNVWGKDGYFPVDESVTSLFPISKMIITIKDLSAGWIILDGRNSVIPSSWMYVRWDGGFAAMKPAKMNEFVKAKYLKIIPRKTMLGRIKNVR